MFIAHRIWLKTKCEQLVLTNYSSGNKIAAIVKSVGSEVLLLIVVMVIMVVMVVMVIMVLIMVMGGWFLDHGSCEATDLIDMAVDSMAEQASCPLLHLSDILNFFFFEQALKHFTSRGYLRNCIYGRIPG